MRHKGGAKMTNLKKLKAKFVENDVTVEQAANFLKIDASTLYRRLNGDSKFLIDEGEKLAQLLHLSGEEALSIFFAEIVA